MPNSCVGCPVSNCHVRHLCFHIHTNSVFRYTRWFVDWWLLEIISWSFSAICLIVLALVLWKYDGDLVPNWTIGISIEAFISICSGFVKSTMLLPVAEAIGQLKWDFFREGVKRKSSCYFETLDAASRGPWGSLVLLVRSRRM